tara:strand:- start:288 stop:728 length:441 start_codon:yes stop_codon:yes gene_type:complete
MAIDDNAAEQAVASMRRWQDAFNSRDPSLQVAEMHFPHHRLAGSVLNTWVTADEWIAGQLAVDHQLRNEGWQYTKIESINAIQGNPEKIHLVIRMSRRDDNDAEYIGFDTLWIFTKVDGRWGAKLRSSYLASSNQLAGTFQDDQNS